MLVGILSEINCLKIPPEEDVTHEEMASGATLRCTCPSAMPRHSHCGQPELCPQLLELSAQTPNPQHFRAGQEPRQAQTESKPPLSPAGRLSLQCLLLSVIHGRILKAQTKVLQWHHGQQSSLNSMYSIMQRQENSALWSRQVQNHKLYK